MRQIPKEIVQCIEQFLIDFWRLEHAVQFRNCLTDISPKRKYCTSYHHLAKSEKALFLLP